MRCISSLPGAGCSGTEDNFKDCIFSFAFGESKPAGKLCSNAANGKPKIKNRTYIRTQQC